GKLKLLATGSRERLKDYPRVATIAETLAGVYADTWMAVAAPPGTPKEIAEKVSQAIRQGFQQRELRAHPCIGSRSARQHAARDARVDPPKSGNLGAGDRGRQDRRGMTAIQQKSSSPGIARLRRAMPAHDRERD